MPSDLKPNFQQRILLSPGKGPPPRFARGSKVVFDFKTTYMLENGDEFVVDNSKTTKKPMELLLGKEFKLPVWEECIKIMTVGEISKFRVGRDLVTNYPFISKTYRQYAGLTKPEANRHCCGMSLNQGTGHGDLDTLMENPRDLEFVIELLRVDEQNEYEKEVWEMDPNEKLDSIPKLKEEGNKLYKENKYKEASQKYFKALSIIEQLLLREKPDDDDWIKLDQMKIPLLSNYSQCKLLANDYYDVIRNTDEVIKRDPDNVKAYYRRGKANQALGNFAEARDDFNKVKQLDAKSEKCAMESLKQLDLDERQKDEDDKSKLQGKLFS